MDALLGAVMILFTLSASADDRSTERGRMVDGQLAARGVADPRVLEAMRVVPRHRFVPQRWQDAAYDDSPLPIAAGQTISQPYIVARMTELLELEPGDKVFELGTGSGYQAAVASRIAAHVWSTEIHAELATEAQATLAALGYDNVTVRHADGYFGLPAEAPFDAILVTAAASHIPPPLLEQLRPGGRMVVPIGPSFSTQRLMLVEKDERGEIRTRSVLAVRFVPLLGRGAGE